MWVGRIDGEVACVFGVVPPTICSDTAYLWLWVTEAVKEHQFIFVRRSQVMLKELLKEYRALTGACKVGDDTAVRWIKWLGGRFAQPERGFVPFVIEAQHG